MSVDPMALEALFLFAGARLGIVLTPGPVNVLLLSYALRKDIQGAAAIAIGATSGSLMLLALVCSGLPERRPDVVASLAILKWAGVAYLLHVAWRMWHAGPVGALPMQPMTRRSRPILAGLLASLANPASLLFFLAVVPSLHGIRGAAVPTFLVLACVNTAVLSVAYAGMIALAAGVRPPSRTTVGTCRIERLSASAIAITACWIALW